MATQKATVQHGVGENLFASIAMQSTIVLYRNHVTYGQQAGAAKLVKYAVMLICFMKKAAVTTVHNL